MWAVVLGLAAVGVLPPMCSGEGGKSASTSTGLFVWFVHPLRSTYVGVVPTPLGLALGLDPKSVTLTMERTRDDPNPRSIAPVKSEPTRHWGLQAWFETGERRFVLAVTLADGSTYQIDPWREPCTQNPQSPQIHVKPYIGIAPGPKRG
jgi:hypothetical protein